MADHDDTAPEKSGKGSWRDFAIKSALMAGGVVNAAAMPDSVEAASPKTRVVQADKKPMTKEEREAAQMAEMASNFVPMIVGGQGAMMLGKNDMYIDNYRIKLDGDKNPVSGMGGNTYINLPVANQTLKQGEDSTNTIQPVAFIGDSAKGNAQFFFDIPEGGGKGVGGIELFGFDKCDATMYIVHQKDLKASRVNLMQKDKKGNLLAVDSNQITEGMQIPKLPPQIKVYEVKGKVEPRTLSDGSKVKCIKFNCPKEEAALGVVVMKPREKAIKPGAIKNGVAGGMPDF